MRRLHSGMCLTQPQTDAGASADSRRWYRSTDSREFTQTIQESARICVNLPTGTLCQNRRNTDPQIHANSRRLFKNLRESASICGPVRSARIGGTPIHRFTRIHAGRQIPGMFRRFSQIGIRFRLPTDEAGMSLDRNRSRYDRSRSSRIYGLESGEPRHRWAECARKCHIIAHGRMGTVLHPSSVGHSLQRKRCEVSRISSNVIWRICPRMRAAGSYCQMLWIGLESGGALLRRFR